MVIVDTGTVTAPEQHAPPVYGIAAGAVLHAHAGDTLEPAVLLHTFLPPGVAELFRTEPARVDVHSDGPGSPTLTVRLLVGGTALSWQLPVAPFVAALPGQSGDDGRMVLLGVVDAEPDAGFHAVAADCEHLAAELQLPVADLVEALRGRLTTWLADDLELLMHDDAHDRAVDRSPAQTLASAVLTTYRGELDAEQATSRLVRALELAPDEYTTELGARLCSALAAAVLRSGETALAEATTATGPFESETLRQLGGLPAALSGVAVPLRTETTMDFLLAGPDRDDAVRSAVSIIARLARHGFGTDLPDDEVLRRLGMVDDRGLARLATLWVQLAAGAAREPAGDPLVAREVGERAEAEAEAGLSWLATTAAALVGAGLEVVGRNVGRIAEQVQAVQELLEAEEPTLDHAVAAASACLSLARLVRNRAGIGPGTWLHLPAPLVAAVVLEQWADGLAAEVVVDLLDELLDDDVEPADVLDGLVCATAQLLVESDPHDDPAALQTQVDAALSAVPSGPRSARWLLVTCLGEANVHDPAAVALAPYLPREHTDPDRAAEKAGRQGILAAGLRTVRALADSFGDAAQLPRPVSLGVFLSSALSEHELLRRPL